MSQLFVDNIKNRTGGAIGAPSGAVVTGVVTATSFSGDGAGLTGVGNTDYIVGIAATFSGNVSIGGTLTYEDVTNVDSVGIITARDGVNSLGIVTGTAFVGHDYLQAPFNTTVTFDVTVATKDSTHRYPAGGGSSSNGYKINGVFAPFITLTPGRTYRFNQLDSSNNNHPIVFYKEADKTTEYSTGVVFNADGSRADSAAYNTNFNSASTTRYVEITISDSTPVVLHYQCYNHGYMGNAVNSNSNTSGSGGGGITTAASSPSANSVVTLDLSSAQHHDLTLTAGITTITCDGGNMGDSHSVVITQPSSGIATVGFSTYFLFPSGATPAMSEGSSKVDLVSFVVKTQGSSGVATALLASAGLNYQ